MMQLNDYKMKRKEIVDLFRFVFKKLNETSTHDEYEIIDYINEWVIIKFKLKTRKRKVIKNE